MKTLLLSNKAYAAGIILNDAGKCVQAAPILRWMIGKNEQWIINHCRRHSINVQETGDSQ